MHFLRKIILKNECNLKKLKSTWLKPEGYDTGVKIYNCVAKEKVPLIVRNKNYATWYTCGPTVYDSAHMGHASCYIKLDIIQRILKNYFNLNLVTAMNITDVDDKIINKSRSLHKTYTEVAKTYESEFFDNLQSLNIPKPNIILKVSEHIPIIQEFIKKLLVNKFAYVAEDKSVYFDLSKYTNYGKLHNLGKDFNTSDNITCKKNAMDFALWKAPKTGEPYWNSDFGPGRPGWHIECSTLAGNIFGSTVDIHAGGMDLKFPHHENEETQCCAYFNKTQWVNYWIHAGQLHTIQSEKMSKSLKNTVKINDYFNTSNSDVFRIACILSHYRNNMDYSEEMLQNAENVLKTFKFFIVQLNSYFKSDNRVQLNEEMLLNTLAEVMNNVDAALKDDFDTATVVKNLYTLMNVTNKMLNSGNLQIDQRLNEISALLAISNYVTHVFSVFGIDLACNTNEQNFVNDSQNFINLLVDVREKLRIIGISSKDENILSLCDNVRDEMKKYGIVVNDHGKRSSWTR